MDPVRVAVQASDPITLAGLTSYLRSRPEMSVVSRDELTDRDVLVVAVDRITPKVVSMMRGFGTEALVSKVLVTNELKEADLLTAVECRVVSVLSRAAATGDRLVGSVLSAAAGGGVMPPDLLGELLEHVRRLQREVLAPRGLSASGLTPREIDVLRLMADGWDTAEIAGKLCYSERTVKNVIYALTSRLKLKNRPHAVAYAMRAGMI
ncbi:MAG: LuxR family transcriptional regulator [Amycolatopsis sp.]|jgi:DNA-binding NarL/FixJ family response regulator|uniref:helix-turn-helix transcriptional regulator n=1 Tax=Amycolatopsis sp. TaxID=37632 RepID=UPI00260F880D|nr:response regulator transcription factor [Amycolatopsis sp.]MCU1686074.1 LuxR family transcriptional regulator [Amycolatopsis sp.]